MVRGVLAAFVVSAISIASLVSVVAEAAPHRRPSQQAFDACAKSKQGDACSFQGRDDHLHAGTCEVPRAGIAAGSAAPGALVCRRSDWHNGSGSAAPAH